MVWLCGQTTFFFPSILPNAFGWGTFSSIKWNHPLFSLFVVLPSSHSIVTRVILMFKNCFFVLQNNMYCCFYSHLSSSRSSPFVCCQYIFGYIQGDYAVHPSTFLLLHKQEHYFCLFVCVRLSVFFILLLFTFAKEI